MRRLISLSASRRRRRLLQKRSRPHSQRLPRFSPRARLLAGSIGSILRLRARLEADESDANNMMAPLARAMSALTTRNGAASTSFLGFRHLGAFAFLHARVRATRVGRLVIAS